MNMLTGLESCRLAHGKQWWLHKLLCTQVDRYIDTHTHSSYINMDIAIDMIDRHQECLTSTRSISHDFLNVPSSRQAALLPFPPLPPPSGFSVGSATFPALCPSPPHPQSPLRQVADGGSITAAGGAGGARWRDHWTSTTPIQSEWLCPVFY